MPSMKERGARCCSSIMGCSCSIGCTGISGEIYRDFSKAEKILAFNAPVMQFCVYTCIIVISYLGAKLVVGGQLDTAALTAMFTYTSQILMGLMMMSMVFVMFTMSREPMKRAYELLTEQPALDNPENPVAEVADGSIDFENVSFRYSKDAPRKSSCKCLNRNTHTD